MAGNAKIVLPADGSIQKTIAAAKSAEKGPDYFVVLKFEAADNYNLAVAAEGAGGWDEAAKSLTPSDGAYVFLRKDHKVEMAKTVKFAMVDWFPGGLPLKRRMGLQAVKKQVVELLKPLHFELQAATLTDVDQKTIDDKIGFVSGTASHGAQKPAAKEAESPAKKEEAAPAAAAAAAPKKDDAAPAKDAPAKKTWNKGASSGPATGVAKTNFGGNAAPVKAADEAGFQAVLKDVRDDKKDTNWLACTYDAGVVTLVGSGSDGFNGAIQKIDDSAVSFALVRVKEVIDGKTNATKFILVKSVPTSVKPLKRADVATKSGAIEKFFGNAHVSIDIASKNEITEQAAMDKLGQASGTKSNVRAK